MNFSSKKISSEKVGYNFSQAAFSYERAAAIQREAAGKLFAFMQAKLPDGFSPRTIFELGAGTGFFTKRIIPFFPKAKILITDISDEMLFICRRKIASMTGYTDQLAIEFEILDFNCEFEFPPQCDLVVSALSFQWAENLPDLIMRIYSKLPQNAFLLFSILSDGSLIEFRNLFKSIKVDYPVPPHYKEEELQKMLSVFSNIQIESYNLKSTHSGIIPFLKSLKNVGAVNPNTSELIKPGDMKKIINAAPKREFTVTYRITNLLCRK